MITLQKPILRLETRPAATCAGVGMDLGAVEHYLVGISFPAGKHDIVATAAINGAPENILAFFINRLPVRIFRSVGDVSFTVFASSYFFGQD
ncbi:MAG: DUF2795 domain-containing protein [Dehalogenimonas sp.]